MDKKTSVIILVLLVSIQYTSAQAPQPRCADNCASPSTSPCRCGSDSCAVGDVCGFSDIEGNKECFPGGAANCLPRSFVAVGRLLCILVMLAPALVIIMLLIGVITYLSHADNPEGRSTGKDFIKNAIIGAVIIIALVQFAAVVGINVDYNFCINLNIGS